MIQPTLDETAIRGKTRELCEAILEQPAFKTLRGDIDRFLADDKAQKHYKAVSERGRTLHNKQHNGEKLSEEEVDEFEALRSTLLQNPVALGFLEAQQKLNELQTSVNGYLSKTFELGRLPTEEEMSDEEGGCCGGSGGGGCGCEH